MTEEKKLEYKSVLKKSIINKLYLSLGECEPGNDYEIKVYDGRFWISHKEVGSGEPLKQWIEREINACD